MNSQLGKLMVVYLKRQFRINDLKSKHSKARKNAIGMMVLMILLIPIFGLYSGGLAYGLSYVGLARVIPAYSIVITALLTMFLTMLKAGSVLFGFKDYELLTALPMKTETIVHSRFFMMYFLNLCMALVIMLPMGAVYAFYEKPSILFYPLWLLGSILATLVPTTIATIFGAIIVAVSSRFKYANAVSILLTFVFLGIVFVGSFSLSSMQETSMDIANMNALGDMLYQQMCSIYPLAQFFSSAIIENSMVDFLLFAGISIVWYAIFVWILAFQYRNINSRLRGHYAKSNYQLASRKKESALIALYKKEWKRFVTTSIYITNIGIGAIMAIVFIGVCVVMGPKQMEELLQMPGFTRNFMKIGPFIIAAMLGMSCTSCVSLSLEGKNLWILQTLPIRIKDIADSKILVNLTLILPTAMIGGIAMMLRITKGTLEGVFFFLVPVVFSFFIAVFGIFINTKFSNYEWESEVTVVKQSAASMIGMLGNAGIALLPMLAILRLSTISYHIITLVFLLVIISLTLFLYQRLCSMQKI